MKSFIPKRTIKMIFQTLSNYFKAIESLNSKFYSVPYEEITEMGVFQRFRLYDFSFETLIMILLATMALIFSFGRGQNTKITNRIFFPLNDFMYLQFANIGFTYKMKRIPYLSEFHNTLVTGFYTGRKNVESVEVKLHLSSRFNPLGLLMEKLMKNALSGIMEDNLEEFVEINIKPNNRSTEYKPSKSEDTTQLFEHQTRESLPKKYQFVAGIVAKHAMTSSRKKYYYLNTVPLVETVRLPKEYVFMTENNTISNGIFFNNNQDNKELEELLEKSKNILKSFTITDLPDDQPILDTDFDKSSSRIHIVLKTPKNIKEVDAMIDLIKYGLSIYDNLTAGTFDKIFMNPNLLKKLDHLRKVEKDRVLKVMKEVEQEMKKKELQSKK